MNRNTNPLKNDLYQVGTTMSLCGISLPDRSVLQYLIVIPPKNDNLSVFSKHLVNKVKDVIE